MAKERISYRRAGRDRPGAAEPAEHVEGRPKSETPRDGRGRWLPGYSGNAAGRAIGCRSRLNQLADAMFGQAAPEIIATVIERAKQGDATCLQLAMSRISPAIRGSTMALPGLPPLDTVENCDEALGAVIEAGACGRITTDQTSLLVDWIRTKQESLGARQLAERLKLLEARPVVDLEAEVLKDIRGAAA